MPSLIVHFKKPSGWSGPCRIHYWDTTPVVTPTGIVRPIFRVVFGCGSFRP